MSKIIEPSLLAFDVANIEQQLNEVKKLGTQYIHYDVMDGKFVPNHSFKTEHLQLISDLGLKANVHFMVQKPLYYVKEFIKYPLNSIVFHPESISKWKAKRVCRYLANNNIPYGLAIKSDTDVNKYVSILANCHYVLIMGVVPGKGGQPFIESTITNLINVKKIKDNVNNKLIIQLDGGVNESVMQRTAHYVDHFIIGNYLMNYANNKKIIFDLAAKL
jgi:ribulose-phosphate 3-epimerase